MFHLGRDFQLKRLIKYREQIAGKQNECISHSWLNSVLESARATDSSVSILIQNNLAHTGYGDFSDTDACIKTSLNLGCLR